MELENVNIGVKIRAVINENGISQAQFGRILGKPTTSITRLLKKITIKSSELNALSQATGHNFFMDFDSEASIPIKFRLSYPHAGKLIAAKAKEKKVSQAELGKFLGVSHQEISRLLKSKSIDSGKLYELSVFLKHNFFADFYYIPSNAEEKIICSFIEFQEKLMVEFGFSLQEIRSVIRNHLNEAVSK